MVILLMGVMGSGKTALGRALARELGGRFFDADDAHSPENRDRLARGEALDEADRAPWLREVARVLAQPHAEPLVVACSALRRRHRDLLRAACPDLRLVFLSPSVATLQRRLAARRDHFAAPTLLASQLATLEPPEPGEGAIVLDNEDSVAAVVATLLAAL
jgi:gluconokinase